MVLKLGLYAYGVVGESLKQLNILGIDKENKVYPVVRNNLVVLVSTIDTGKFSQQVKEGLSELKKAGQTLQAHEEVVESIAESTTIVPFKFGTILKDEKSALKMLKDYGEKFRGLLAKFTGREEWGLKVYVDEKKFKNCLGSEAKFKKQADIRKPSRGIAYLLGKKMEDELNNEFTQRLNETTQVILRELKKIAFEVQLNKLLPKKLTGKDKEMILNSAYLLEKEKVGNFNKQIEKLVEKYQPLGLDLEVSGPWPPYSFTS